MSLGHPEVKTSELKHCPLLDRKCLGNECMLWVRFDKDDKTAFETCALIMQNLLTSQTIVEEIRTQGAVQHQTNQIAATFLAIQRGVNIPVLSGNREKDLDVLKGLVDDNQGS